MLVHTDIGYDDLSSKFDFQGPELKVKITVAIFRKNFVIALVPTFINRILFNFNTNIGITISQASSTFRVLRSKLRSVWLVFRKKKHNKTKKPCYGSSSYFYRWILI